MRDFLISPSLLSADFARLGEEAQAVLLAGADMVHLDVMDNHYVPNLTVGPVVCAALRRYGITQPIDVHLMTTPVDRLINEFGKAGASYITFHPEATNHVDRSLALIRDQGCKAGIALNPSTSLHCLEYIMDKIDLILVMSVNPGFSGQKFIPDTIKKLEQLRTLVQASGKSIRIAVDGGIKVDNIFEVATAGADMFIAGSAIYNQPDYRKSIQALRDELKRVTS